MPGSPALPWTWGPLAGRDGGGEGDAGEEELRRGSATGWEHPGPAAGFVPAPRLPTPVLSGLAPSPFPTSPVSHSCLHTSPAGTETLELGKGPHKGKVDLWPLSPVL